MFTTLSVFAFACLLASSLLFLASNKKSRDIVISRLTFAKRRNSGANTPPRSFSLEKDLSKAQESPYKDIFPPSQRDALAHVKASHPALQTKSEEDLTTAPVDATTNCVPLKTSIYDLKEAAFTPTGFSTDEVKALGDFPDYAALSGVPLPEAYTDFDINKALPRPYRPFRWAYHQTMSLTKMENDWWLELDKNYTSNLKLRQSLYAEHGTSVLNHLPGSELACKELMEMCLQFLCARYPQYFRLDKEAMVFHNHVLDIATDLRTTSPLHVLLNNVPEDFGIMLRDPENGYYFLRAGMICSSLGWSLGSKMGMQLHEIHAPIPDYKEKMQFSMDRYFSKKPTNKPIQRGSWGLEVSTPLYMPPGDPHELHRETQAPTLDISDIFLRVDWQTLRRLPLSGAIVFNFKALFTPITAFRSEPRVPALLLKVLKEGKKSMMEYKNTWHTEHVAVPWLEEVVEEQVEKGLCEKDWEVRTLEESPFYEGWEAKWRAEQGF